jgi:Sulfotransferase family
VLRANAEGQGACEEEYGEREGGSASLAAHARSPSNPREHEEDDMASATDGLRTVTIRTCPNPVFVIGCPRSGTSVLPWALAHHSDFWTSGETEFMLPFFDKAPAVYRELCDEPGTFVPSNGVSHKEFFGSLGLGVNALISSHSEGKRWIDQSPGYTTMAWVLADMFPGAQFIHVVRDGRAVVNSMLHFGDRAAAQGVTKPLQPWATDFGVAVETWQHYVEFALDFCARNPDRSLTLKNEALVERTEEEFNKVFTFLGVRHNSEPANFFRTSRVNSSFGPLVWGSGTGSAAGEPHTDIWPGTAIAAWEAWSAEQRATFTEIAGDLLRRLDYPDEVG